MNPSHTSASTLHRSLPSARTLAAMVLLEVTPNPRPDQRPDDGDPQARSAGGPGWFDSSFDIERGLVVVEGLPADASVDEWIEAGLRR